MANNWGRKIWDRRTFHHFPRPWIALYEAFRVCKKAVILIEPREDEISIRRLVFSKAKRFLKKLFGRKDEEYGFEAVGNFVYRPSLKELEKFLLGMHYRYIATTGMNDHYIAGIEFIDLSTTSPQEKNIIRNLKSFILLKDLLSYIGITSKDILAAALFKEAPTQQIMDTISRSRWELKELPKNPYLLQG